MQMMVLPQSLTQTNCSFSRLTPKPLLAAIGSSFNTDGPTGNLVNMLVWSIYSTMGDLVHDPKSKLYKPQQYVIAF